MKLLKTCLLLGFAAAAFATAFVYFGMFNVAADVPHSNLAYRLMEAVRDRSIAERAKHLQVPSLEDPKLVVDGAKHYVDMCIDCHLAPGIKEAEIRVGLYPAPPNLSEHIDASPAEMFWVIKHGIKMSAMPAWGKTHDDQSIWSIVAFLQRLPELTPEQYQVLVGSSGEAHHHSHDHDGTGKPGAEGIGHSHHQGGASPQAPEDAHPGDHRP